MIKINMMIDHDDHDDYNDYDDDHDEKAPQPPSFRAPPQTFSLSQLT